MIPQGYKRVKASQRSFITANMRDSRRKQISAMVEAKKANLLIALARDIEQEFATTVAEQFNQVDAEAEELYKKAEAEFADIERETRRSLDDSKLAPLNALAEQVLSSPAVSSVIQKHFNSADGQEDGLTSEDMDHGEADIVTPSVSTHLSKFPELGDGDTVASPTTDSTALETPNIERGSKRSMRTRMGTVIPSTDSTGDINEEIPNGKRSRLATETPSRGARRSPSSETLLQSTLDSDKDAKPRRVRASQVNYNERDYFRDIGV